MRQHYFITLVLITLTGLLVPAAPAQARVIFIAGDSTASVYGPEVYPRMGWGQVLGDFYGDDISVVDLAQSGRSSRSFIDEGFFAELERQIGPEDILLIQFGHNDEKIDSPERYTAPETDYKEYLGKYIAMAREKDAIPVLLTSIVRRKFEDGKLVPTHGKYPDAVRELAADTGTALIDMTRLSGQFVTRLGEEQSKSVYLHLQGADGPIEDNTHFSESGAYAMAALIARGLNDLHLVSYRQPGQALTGVGQDGSGDVTQVRDAIKINVQIALDETRNIKQ